MAERTGFWTTVREMIESGTDPEVAVRAVLDNPDYRENVINLLTNQVRGQVVRGAARKAEHEARIRLENKDIAGANSVLASQTFPRTRQVSDVVKRSFPNSEGQLVEWTKASAEDHRSRAFWFRRQANTFNNTASLHELAAQLIDEAGVACLAEIDSVEKWPELAEMISSPATKAFAAPVTPPNAGGEQS